MAKRIVDFLNLMPAILSIGGVFSLLIGLSFYHGFFYFLGLPIFALLTIQDYLTVTADVVLIGLFVIFVGVAGQVFFSLFGMLVSSAHNRNTSILIYVRSILVSIEEWALGAKTRILLAIFLVVLIVVPPLVVKYIMQIDFDVTPPAPAGGCLRWVGAYRIVTVLSAAALIYFAALSHKSDRRIFLLIGAIVLPPLAANYYGKFAAEHILIRQADNVEVEFSSQPARSFVFVARLDLGIALLDRRSRMISVVRWDAIKSIKMLSKMSGDSGVFLR
jgi:hypothetical protein